MRAGAWGVFDEATAEHAIEVLDRRGCPTPQIHPYGSKGSKERVPTARTVNDPNNFRCMPQSDSNLGCAGRQDVS